MRHRENKFAAPTVPCSNSAGRAFPAATADGMEGSARFPQLASSTPPNAATDHPIVVIEKRRLLGECLSRAMKAFGRNVVSFLDVESWLGAATCTPASLVVLCVGSRAGSAETHQAISSLLCAPVRYPTVILSDAEDPGQIVAALEQGVRGYISTNMPLRVAMEALQLVQVGGLFVPASSLMAAAKSTDQDGWGKIPWFHFAASCRGGSIAARQGEQDHCL